MAKFRKRPIVIDAYQFTGEERADPVGVQRKGERAFVTTAHGQPVYLEPGDWITIEPNGQGYYPIKPDILAATYEPA